MFRITLLFCNFLNWPIFAAIALGNPFVESLALLWSLIFLLFKNKAKIPDEVILDQKKQF